jgi:hypothetical protein
LSATELLQTAAKKAAVTRFATPELPSQVAIAKLAKDSSHLAAELQLESQKLPYRLSAQSCDAKS